jgi:alpha-galactosidase
VSRSVAGVDLLELVVTDAGDGFDFDHADWGDARVVCR